ncbi:MAG TPA: hypothetical protein VN181_13050, partial [Thermoanaerobaculia bacterium]|nr:hypothetical protein [Thermoanaerobaculia bacterium]
MKSCFFGLGYDFDGGVDPGVAINENGLVLEVHKNEGGWSLYARTGNLEDATIAWNDTGSNRGSYTSGSEPACAMNRYGDIVEVHKREVGDKLYAMYGKASGTSITWGDSNDYDGDGHLPAVALNDSGRCVSVFQKNTNQVRYCVGSIDTGDEEVNFEDPHDLATGTTPKVAMDNAANVIAVWNVSGEMRYCVGKVDSDGETIAWGTILTPPPKFGLKPSVALTNSGYVILVYNSAGINQSMYTGTLNASAKTVAWDEEGAAPQMRYYDDGLDPVVAAAGNMAVEIHQGEGLPRLWYSTSIITDRANWMHDRLNQLGS